MPRPACSACVLSIWACLAATPASAAPVSEFVFENNFEAAPDCSSVGYPGCPGFAIETPRATIAAGSTADYCFYFRTPNAGTVAIGRFSSTFDPVTAHIIVYTTVDGTGAPVDAQTPGTFAADCGFIVGKNGTTAHWLYAAHDIVEQMRMPDDDGTGNPLAIALAANTAGFVEIYFENAGASDVLAAPVRIEANELPGAAYTAIAAYMTLETNISIANGSSGQSTPNACSVPASVKFWRFTTQTHSHATSAESSNSLTHQVLVSSTSWESPAIALFASPSFYQFGASDQLTTTCSYANNTGSVLTFGDSYTTDETCIGVGYFFPADGPKNCIDGSGPQ